MHDIKKDVVIIGAGPAGLAAAIQLNRYNVTFLIIEENSIGGLLKNANKVENYLGFPEGISGNELIELFQKQISKNTIQIIFEKVTDVDYQCGRFLITTKNSKLESRIAVIASGTKPKEIKNLTNDIKTQSKIFYEVYKIQNLNSQEIAIIGAGDAAFDYALNLSRKNNITIFNRKDKEKCLPVLKKLVDKNQNIQYKTNRILKKIKLIDDKLNLNFQFAGQSNTYLFDYLLLAIGREPELDFLGENIKRKMKFLVAEKKLFFIGDVKSKHYRQLSIASGDGIRVAMEINEILNRTQN